MIGIIISIISIIISIIVIVKVNKSCTGRARNEIQRYKEIEFQKEKEKYIEKLEAEFDSAKAKKYQELESLNNEIVRRNELFEIDKKTKEQLLEATLEAKREEGMTRVNREVDDWAASMQESANLAKDHILSENKKICDASKKELELVLEEIKEYKERRDAINQEILRSRALEEKQDFYRIQLDETSKEDIEVLNNIRQKLNKTDLLNKLIYDNYIARPAKEMVKRVLEGKNPCGIYKATNIKTNEIYIGKSVKIGDRFLNHIKSACGLEGVAESQFQRALKKYGVDSFTWELLEECPKENLTEKEKYYIMFYGTKEYGYNQREG